MSNWFRPNEDSVLGRLLGRRVRHPNAFECGIRVVEGELPGESGRWHYRPSTIDSFPRSDSLITLYHGGEATLLLSVEPDSLGGGAPRNRHTTFAAREVPSNARVEVSVESGQLDMFGLG